MENHVAPEGAFSFVRRSIPGLLAAPFVQSMQRVIETPETRVPVGFAGFFTSKNRPETRATGGCCPPMRALF
jgi:hypothetical protein